MLEKAIYRGTPAWHFENDEVSAQVVECGGRIVSLFSKPYRREMLVQSPPGLYARRSFDVPYSSFPCAGIDDMFPTIDPWICDEHPWAGVGMPDHGEVFSLDWDCGAEDESLCMCVHGIRFPYTLEKKLELAGTVLRIDYRLTNLSSFALPCLWALHPALRLEKESCLDMPDLGNAILVFSESGRLGKYFDKVDIQTNADGFFVPDDSPAFSEESYMDKWYFERGSETVRCRVMHPDGSSLSLAAEGTAPLYLGVLVTGGMHLGRCAMVECCTAPFDRPDYALKSGYSPYVKGGDVLEWSVALELSFIR